MWTTKEGLESWWGPEGFSAVVRKLDVRLGGEYEIALTAEAAEQLEGVRELGVATTTIARGTYTEVHRPRRLAFSTIADFIPGVDPYDVRTLVEFHPVGRSVRLVVTIEAMHDEQWTQLSRMGEESQLDRLAEVLRASG